MGQQVGRMPDTWDELIEEKDRVLHWSAEILSRVEDNVTNEDTFLINFDNKKIDEKVKKWIASNTLQLENAMSKIGMKEDCKNEVTSKIAKISEDISTKMRKEYQFAYSDLMKFSKRVDKLGREERTVHDDIQQLEEKCNNDSEMFKKKFGPLRLKVFNNLRVGEKMIFEDKRLKTEFTKKIYDVDHANIAECVKRFKKLQKDYEKCVNKE